MQNNHNKKKFRQTNTTIKYKFALRTYTYAHIQTTPFRCMNINTEIEVTDIPHTKTDLKIYLIIQTDPGIWTPCETAFTNLPFPCAFQTSHTHIHTHTCIPFDGREKVNKQY